MFRLCIGEEEAEELQVDETELWPLSWNNLWGQAHDRRCAVWDAGLCCQRHRHVPPQSCLAAICASRWVHLICFITCSIKKCCLFVTLLKYASEELTLTNANMVSHMIRQSQLHKVWTHWLIFPQFLFWPRPEQNRNKTSSLICLYQRIPLHLHQKYFIVLIKETKVKIDA